MRLALLIVLMLSSASAAASPQDAVAPAAKPFTYHAPKGFSALPGEELPDGCLAGFIEDGEKAPVTLFVFQSARILNQRDTFVPEADLGDGFPSVFRENWHGVYIFGVRYVAGPDDALVVHVRLYVPLTDRTIWLQTQSPVTRELDALIALRQTLATCQGETNWRPDAPPVSRGASIYDSGGRYNGINDFTPSPGFRSKVPAPEGLAIRSSINSLFWASVVCSLPFALAWGLWMMRRRPQVAFVATTRPLYRELKGWGGPVPRP
jgi:hypothetical protein